MKNFKELNDEQLKKAANEALNELQDIINDIELSGYTHKMIQYWLQEMIVASNQRISNRDAKIEELNDEKH